MCVTFVTFVKCVCVAFVAVAGRRYTYTVCTDSLTLEVQCLEVQCYLLYLLAHLRATRNTIVLVTGFVSCGLLHS